ncbi:hypothetical protein [Paenibacillus physcomitrellae]|uniref:DUF4829 domain-containing protein n=1 Tax=Paenibacillus physcomitrellae TaxID=1619311 RepID=A0ABQ1GH58_9BACL|nr:hypothetical protein [Paenibacillus physcomitrellae]GGA43460.1 hypothetical protein GCM10010917_30940 [Paenibacillus physcomitrellae]
MIKPMISARQTAAGMILLTGLLTACSHPLDTRTAAVQASLSESNQPDAGQNPQKQTEPISRPASALSSSVLSPSPSSSSASTFDSPPDSASAASTASFKEGIFVDVQALDNPLVNQDIKGLLNKLMKAVVDRDKEAFAKLFPDSQTATYFDYQFEGSPKFRFEQAGDGVIEQDAEGRVSIPVEGKVIREGQIYDFFWLVYFNRIDPDGWKLIALD